MKIFFPGSFNPFTKGHADILMRLLRLADSVVVGIGCNSEKPSSDSQAHACRLAIEDFIQKNGLASRVSVVVYDGLSAQEALNLKADCMARGVRSASDFDYEYSLAAANRAAFGLETLLFPADPSLSFVSSSMIRDLQNHGRGDIAEKFLP